MPRAYSRPHFVVSSLSSPLFSVEDLRAVAADWRFDGVDLDLTHWWSRRRHSRLVLPATSRRQTVRSVWVSPSCFQSVGGKLAAIPEISAALDELEGVTIVVADGGDALGDRLRGERFELAATLRSMVEERHRVCVGVRAATRAAGRAHLVRLRALRALTEEWDLGLALDLSDADDWQWEAEAAVFHAAPNLDLIRLALPGATFDAHVRSRLTMRTLASAVDSGFAGIFALAPHLPIWRWRSRDLMEALCGEGREKIVMMMRGDRDALIRSDAPSWTRH